MPGPPDPADALHARGVQHAMRGEFPQAVELIGRALAARPDHPPALFDLGAALMGAGRFADALARFDRLASLAPGAPDVAYNRGLALRALGRPAEALAAFDRALAARPSDAEALANRGGVLLALHRPEDALASYERALALQPRAPEALNGAGVALRALGRLDEAIARFDRALAERADFADARWNRAGALLLAGRCAEALADYRRLDASRRPAAAAPGEAERSDPASQLLLAMRTMCEWRDLAPVEARVVEAVRAGAAAIHPATFLIVRDDPDAQRACADRWMRGKRPIAAAPAARPRDGARVRLGYLAGEMRDHALMRLMAGLFEAHDRARFAIHAYSYGPDDRSPLRRRLEAAFDRFADVRALDDESIARRIAADEIDVLVDLSGHTEGNRIEILARRPAPVTVHCLGYPGTLGAGAVDWLIADPFLAAAGEGAFAEALAILPDCYQVNDRRRAIAEATPTRAECSLPADGFVFCCFNNSFKIAPPFFAAWMRLLAATPGSVLWLLGDNRWVEENLRREAEARGVAGARIVFAPRVPLADHLARHRLADLFLDTLPYGAHTTASDALWTGLPVLTVAGRSFAARVCGSLLTAVGLPELITTGIDEYEALALALARDPARLAALRARLAAARDAAPLFDTARYRRHIEHAYATMLERRARGEAPATFAVPSLD